MFIRNFEIIWILPETQLNTWKIQFYIVVLCYKTFQKVILGLFRSWVGGVANDKNDLTHLQQRYHYQILACQSVNCLGGTPNFLSSLAHTSTAWNIFPLTQLGLLLPDTAVQKYWCMILLIAWGVCPGLRDRNISLTLSAS